MKQPKKAKTTLSLTPPNENPEPKSKMFFFSVQTRRLLEPFEYSYSSLASSSGELSRVIASYSSRQWETHAFSDFGGKMGFLGFWFQTCQKVKQGLYRRGRSSSFQKKFEPKFWPISLAFRARQSWSKNQKHPILRASPRRIPHPNKKNFFQQNQEDLSYPQRV